VSCVFDYANGRQTCSEPMSWSSAADYPMITQIHGKDFLGDPRNL